MREKMCGCLPRCLLPGSRLPRLTLIVQTVREAKGPLGGSVMYVRLIKVVQAM